MAKLDIKFEIEKWQVEVKQILTTYRMDLTKELNNQMRLLCQDLQRRTFAFVKGGDTIFNKRKSKKKWVDPAERIVRENFVKSKASNVVYWKKRYKKAEPIDGMPLFYPNATNGDITRDLKRRTYKGKTQQRYGYVEFGNNIKFRKAPHVDIPTINSAVARIKETVGKAKSGWNNAIAFFGGLSNIKSYILRHGTNNGSSGSKYTDTYAETSTINHVGIPDFERGYAGAFRTRYNFLYKILPNIIKNSFDKTKSK